MAMDLNAMMAAAQNDPKAAAFLQQLLAGGTPMSQRLPEIAPQALRAPEIVDMPEQAAMPVFQPAKNAMDKLLGQYTPQPAAGQPGQPGAAGVPPDPAAAAGGAPVAPPGIDAQGPMPRPVDPGMLGQMEGQGPITETPIGVSPEQAAAGQGDPGSLMDFLTMAKGWLGQGGAA